LAEEITSAKLLQDYETIRRREVELITNLLEVLPKVDRLDDHHLNQVRDAMFHADHPFMMVFVGPFNSGKSSLINALTGIPDLLKIGPTPVTDRIAILRYGDDAQPMGSRGGVDTVYSPYPLLKKVSFVDTPGLESVFKEHAESTRKFLHRADVVLLTMLATQAMTQSNLESMQLFKEYGKKVILVINQADLLSDTERETVKVYVQEQSRDRLGFTPEIWMVSAKWGLEAHANGELDADLWQKSGMWQIEGYIEKQLGDANRLRQKLQTPLQIAQNAHHAALEAVRENQSTFDNYRAIGDNLQRQLDSQMREAQKTVRETNSAVEERYKTAIERAGEALREAFSLSKALGLLRSGFLELTMISVLLRAGKKPNAISTLLEAHRVYEPINELPAITDKLAPRLEGQDMKDTNDLAQYAQREIEKMPANMRDKVIGLIQPPTTYDRSHMLNMRQALEIIEGETKVLETEKLETARRNTLIYLAVWQLICAILLFALFGSWGVLSSTNENPIEWVLLLGIIVLMGLGFLALPLRGNMIHRSFANRLLKLQANYIETITKASDKQIETGMQLRRDAIKPLSRLIDSQSDVQSRQMVELQQAEQIILKLETDLNALGKRKILGFTM
jgi:GTP-binding protein EngB required for normal cell division